MCSECLKELCQEIQRKGPGLQNWASIKKVKTLTKSSLKEKWMCKLSKKRKLTAILRVFENCSSWPFSVIECKPWNTYLSPRTKVPTYLTIFDSIMVQKLRQMNMSATASYPEVPLSRWKFARKGRRERENCQDVASLLFFHLPMVPWASLPVTRVSRSPLCEKRSA